MSFDVANEAAVNSDISVDGGDIHPATHIKGKAKTFEQTHTATDKIGKTARVYAKVVNAYDVSYSSSILPKGVSARKTVPWVTAEQWLNVGQADYIKCTALASYASASLLADAGIELPNGGSLFGYYSKAYASDTNVEASQ